MVKHIILWKLKDELAGEEKEQVRQESKKDLKDWQDRFRGSLR